VKRLLSATLVAAFVGGCWSMAPTYERPASPVPAQLPGGTGSTAAPITLDAFIKEPRLRQILTRVVAQNRSLRRTALDVESARQLYRIQRAEALPAVNATAGVVRSRQYVGLPGAPTVDISSYQVGIGISAWELDLFGRIKSQSDAALQQYLAAVELVNATRIALVSETATAYTTLAADKSRLVIATDTMATAKKAMDLTEQLVGGGTSNRGDFWQATTVYQQARADVAVLTAAIARDRNALELLAGGPIDDALLPDALPDQLDWFADVPVGVSSSVLLERPDVLAAEHQLIAANANIGAARAAFFPSISLTGSGGLISSALAKLFTGPTGIWSLAANHVQPLFRGGSGVANLEYAKTQKQTMIAAYELAIQTAFREVADALATRTTIQERLAAETDLNTAAQNSLELAQARYQIGVDPFLTTLVSERALYGARSSLIAARFDAMLNRIALYRAMAR
jgi:multidrug efflux system outer membrane protein